MKEEDIIAKLYLKEEDVLKQTEQIVEALLPHVGIDPESKRVIIKNSSLSNREKIGCYLIAKYFMKKQGMTAEDTDINELEKELGVVKTTLSGPLGVLTTERFIDRVADGRYVFKFHRIKEFVSKIGAKNG